MPFMGNAVKHISACISRNSGPPVIGSGPWQQRFVPWGPSTAATRRHVLAMGASPTAFTFDCAFVAAGREPSGFAALSGHSPDGLRRAAR